MKKLLVLCSLLTLLSTMALAQLGGKKTYDAEGMDGEIRDLPDFDAVVVSMGTELYIHQADEQRVEVKSSSTPLSQIKTEVKKGVLYVKTKSQIITTSSRRSPRVDIWIDDLNSIKAKMGSDVHTDGQFQTDELIVEGRMGSDLNLNLDVKKLSGRSGGGSEMHLNGEVDEIELESRSGSDIDASKCFAKRGTIKSRGGSGIKVNVSEEVSVSASMGSDIYLKGDAKVIREKSSMGSDIHHSKKKETI